MNYGSPAEFLSHRGSRWFRSVGTKSHTLILLSCHLPIWTAFAQPTLRHCPLRDFQKKDSLYLHQLPPACAVRRQARQSVNGCGSQRGKKHLKRPDAAGGVTRPVDIMYLHPPPMDSRLGAVIISPWTPRVTPKVRKTTAFPGLWEGSMGIHPRESPVIWRETRWDALAVTQQLKGYHPVQGTSFSRSVHHRAPGVFAAESVPTPWQRQKFA